MKSKILKILGVVITVALVCGLAVAFTAAPVAADPDEWTTYDYPDAGADGDWFIASAVAANEDIFAIGTVARDIDGYFWISVTIDADGGADLDAGEQQIMKSLDTEGRSWEATDFSNDLGVAALTVNAAVVDIIPSDIDADIVYVAVADAVAAVDAVYKTEDGGDEWEEVSDLSAALTAGGGVTEAVTCMDVGYVDDEPHIYVGTTDAAGADGEVYYLNDVAFGGAWTDLNVQGTDTGVAAGDSQVLDIACSSDFDNDAMVAALIICDGNADADMVDAGVDLTLVSTNVGASVGTWPDVELTDDAAATDPMTAGAIAFVDDFDADDAYEFFVATSGATHVASGLGGVYRVYGELNAQVDILDDVDDDLATLDLAGDVGGTYLLAGAAGAADVWYSDDDGDNWEQASAEGIQPAGGAVDTTVICGDDIADDGIGWAATGVAQGCMSITYDGGTTWLGISMIDGNVVTVDGLALWPEFPASGSIFVLITDVAGAEDVLRYDGANWERVYESVQYAQAVDMIGVSPDIENDDTIFLGDTVADTILFSEDNGGVWEAMREDPATLNTWAIIDAETILVGGAADGNVYYTDIQGRRAWDDYEVEAPLSTITSLVISGDTVIAGNDDSDVFISEDLGETWDVVGAQVDAAGVATFVAFDTDDISTIYAATDDTIARFLDTSELAEDWENFDLANDPAAVAYDWTFSVGAADATGLVVADGVVYASCNEAVVLQTGVAGVGRGAVTRTVQPLEDVDDVDASAFDQTSLTAQGLAGGEIFDGLDMTTGSTILWAFDTAAATIWTLEDVLAGAVTGGVADPDEGSVALTWDAFDNATDYDVAVYSDEDMGLAYEWHDAATGDDDPVLNLTDGNTTGVNLGNPLDAGTQYWWQVRATAPADSKWSDVWTFTTLPATMTIDADQFGPAVGASNVPITPAFGWQLIEEADEYMFELADNPDFTTPIASVTITSPVYELDTALDYATNYFWRVKAISGTSQSNWATGTFTTMAEPEEAPAPPPPPAAAPEITIPPTTEIAPKWIYAVIGVGATLADRKSVV